MQIKKSWNPTWVLPQQVYYLSSMATLGQQGAPQPTVLGVMVRVRNLFTSAPPPAALPPTPLPFQQKNGGQTQPATALSDIADAASYVSVATPASNLPNWSQGLNVPIPPIQQLPATVAIEVDSDVQEDTSRTVRSTINDSNMSDSACKKRGRDVHSPKCT